MMDMEIGSLIAGFVVSTIGFSLFLYGRKQLRAPQAIGGMLLMACPFVAPGALWMSISAAAVIALTWWGVRSGY